MRKCERFEQPARAGLYCRWCPAVLALRRVLPPDPGARWLPDTDEVDAAPTSLGTGGRGPTMLMSPSRTLISCGSSSSEYLRMKLPIAVICGSRFILNTGPFDSFRTAV
jgi:hypothetical protein